MASSPGTPRSSPSPSPSEDVLTPSRKVQALLARFDESGSDTSAPLSKTREIDGCAAAENNTQNASESSEDGDDALVTRPSRMTARLQGEKQRETSAPPNAQTMEVKEKLVLHNCLKYSEGQSPSRSQSITDSGDELARPAPRRRLLTKRKSGIVASNPVDRLPRPTSTLFFPSQTTEPTTPASTTKGTRPDSDSGSRKNHHTANPKFKALVEKHRKARIEKEAADAAKRATAGKPRNQRKEKKRKPRGSSPADGSDEGSDSSIADAAERLTKDAKPTRKASKKAMEEMKRETQRMSRNMQLAHQARTRKKISKESLLARFVLSVPTLNAGTGPAGDQSATASSDIGSDAEPLRRHETPPTSPLQESCDDKKSTSARASMGSDKSIQDPSGLVVELRHVKDLGIGATHRSPKGKGKAEDWVLGESAEVRSVVIGELSLPRDVPKESRTGKLDTRARVAEILLNQRNNHHDEGIDDLDVITSKGSIRKYAVFERVPKRKAKETQSRQALKSLAHLHDNEGNDRSSMTTAEMSASLMKAARMQAREERQHRIAELKSKGVIVQTAEERERDQQEVEDLVERARQEAAEISKREKELAKKDGTFVKDGLDDDGDSEDEEFEDDEEGDADDDSEMESDDAVEDQEDDCKDEVLAAADGLLLDEEAGESDTEDESVAESSEEPMLEDPEESEMAHQTPAPRRSRAARVVMEEDDDEESADRIVADSPVLPQPTKTPQSRSRSARKHIPGLQMSDDLPLGLTQAFAATMADSQTQSKEQSQQQDSLAMIRDLPSPHIGMAPKLNRLDSLDLVSESQPASQTQPLNISLSFSQSQPLPESPSLGRNDCRLQFTPSQACFEPTQDDGYMFTPFQGNRFVSVTPQNAPQSTVDTVVVSGNVDASPIVQRKGRLQRGRIQSQKSDNESEVEGSADKSAFEVMRRAAKKADQPVFDKAKSNARNVVDEAAEESDDEYAGLGGVSDDDGNDVENEADREMIDHDAQVGQGDEAKLAGLFADRERKNDEAAVSKLLKDISTGALRRKRGVNDDLDLSDEEDAVARRREAKRREFAKMRRELLKDEAVGKIAEDKKKEAFLRSIEDREQVSGDEDDIDQAETPLENSQDQSQVQSQVKPTEVQAGEKRKQPLEPAIESRLNRIPPSLRRTAHDSKPSTLAEIRDSVSFLIEEPDSQAVAIDFGLSDSESEPEAYVNLDRHFKAAEADENAAFADENDLGDFVIDDDELTQDRGDAKSKSQESSIFKKPSLPSQTSPASFADRRTNRSKVVNRLSLLRQSSSTSSNSSSTSSSSKLAFQTNGSIASSFKAPSLLRRATTNSLSSVSSLSSSSENVSATGVTSSRTERGHVSEEKEFIRKGTGGRRNAVNYRPAVKEERMSARAGVQKKQAKAKGGKGGVEKGGFLGALFRGDSWD